MEDKHKRISQDQLDIWMDNPVTRTYLQCLEWSAEQISEVLSKGGLVNPENNDHTSNRIHLALGNRIGLSHALNVKGAIIAHEMLEDPKEDTK